jgi:chromate transporter
MNEKNTLKELARIFFKTRIIGFGGPAVHITMMQNEVVVRKNG